MSKSPLQNDPAKRKEGVYSISWMTSNVQIAALSARKKETEYLCCFVIPFTNCHLAAAKEYMAVARIALL